MYFAYYTFVCNHLVRPISMATQSFNYIFYSIEIC